MNNTLSKALMFVAGAAVGSVATWAIIKTKYERIANEEIESIREFYNNKDKEKLTDEAYGDDEEDENKTDDSEDIDHYKRIIQEEGYSENMKEENEMDVNKPYVISPEDADDIDYDLEQLDYFEGDETLVDSFGDVVENVEEVVGADFASHFGEYEQDTVYVANDAHRLVYEICRDYRSYSEVD